MRVAGQLRTMFLVLVAIQVVTSLAGIALLARMSPAIGSILATHQATIECAERMLAAVALDDGGAFEDALRRAERSARDPDDAAALARVRSLGARARTDAGVRRELIAELRRLAHANRRAMQHADRDARRLGLEGRWALALLGLLGLLASALAMHRARVHLTLPLTELVALLVARRAGDRHRRYTPPARTELASVLADVNEIIDAAEHPVRARGVEAAGLRAALAELLDREGAALVADADGDLVAASRGALDRLAHDGERIRAALREGVLAGEPLGRSGLSLVRLD